MRTCFFFCLITMPGAIFSAAHPAANAKEKETRPPDIVILLADDMGTGDVSALNPQAKVATPNIDSLVRGGIRFIDGHSSAAVCTPSRYGLLTGRYSWRSPSKERVLSGYSACLIPPDRPTLAAFLKTNGYVTAMFGKWHLGLTWRKKDGTPVTELKPPREIETQIDFSAPVLAGPRTAGFDYFYGTAASWDMPPYAFIENDRLLHPERLVPRKGGRVAPLPPELRKLKSAERKRRLAEYPKADWRKGPADSSIRPEDALRLITRRAVEYIEKSDDRPLFLYVSFTSPHTPVVPSADFRGKSRAGSYGDFVQETDAAVGEIVRALRKRGRFENTFLLFTADNGYSPRAFPDACKECYGHDPAAPWSGHKSQLYEGGHRVPFIVSWPAVVTPGRSSDALVCQLDLFATIADILGRKPPAGAAGDSFSFLPVLEGKAESSARDTLVTRSFAGYLAIRQGPWKLSTSRNPRRWRLVNLAEDPAERRNLFADHPEKVETLKRLLQRIVDSGRSTPGPPLPNDGPARWEQIRWMPPPAGTKPASEDAVFKPSKPARPNTDRRGNTRNRESPTSPPSPGGA